MICCIQTCKYFCTKRANFTFPRRAKPQIMFYSTLDNSRHWTILDLKVRILSLLWFLDFMFLSIAVHAIPYNILWFSIILVSVNVITNLNTEKDPCIIEEKFDLYKCAESYFYEQHGCQFPWNVYRDLNVPICTNLTYIKDLINIVDRDKGKGREGYSNLQRIDYTKGKCQIPCEVMRYSLQYEDNSEQMMNEAAGKFSLVIEFENFMIEKRTEFEACDKTCVIGELGGNLGFFLGGSILAFFDILICTFSMIVAMMQKRCKKSSPIACVDPS